MGSADCYVHVPDNSMKGLDSLLIEAVNNISLNDLSQFWLLCEAEYVNTVRSNFFPGNRFVVFQIGNYIFYVSVFQQIHRLKELFRLEETFELIKSNHPNSARSTAKPCP